MKYRSNGVKLSRSEWWMYYSSSFTFLMIPMVDLFFLVNSGNTPLLKKAPIFYFLALAATVIDFKFARKNLKIEEFEIENTAAEFTETLEIMKKERNWRIILKKDDFISALSINTEYLWVPARVNIWRTENTISIASFIDPRFSSGWNTGGERRRNIDEFIANLKLTKEDRSFDQIIEHNDLKRNLDLQYGSEWTKERLTKRIVAYVVFAMSLGAVYLYKDSDLIIPMIFISLMVVWYLVGDMRIVIVKMRRPAPNRVHDIMANKADRDEQK